MENRTFDYIDLIISCFVLIVLFLFAAHIDYLFNLL